MNKIMKITFAVSLIINLVMLGVFVGRGSLCLKDRCRMNRHHKPFGPKMQELGDLAKSGHEEMKAVRDELFTILTAETFDPELYQSKLDQMFGLYQSKMKAMSQKIKEKAMTMSQVERKELAEEMRRFHRHREHKDD